MIVVVSKDKDFSHTLAEHIVRELEQPCECVEDIEDLGKTASAVLAILTDKGLKPKDMPSLLVTPPVRMRELLADISGRLGNAENEIALANQTIFSPRKKTLSHASGREATLTDKEAQLIHAIHAAGNTGIGKDRLLKTIWGIEADLNTHTLETHIYRLRAKCKDVSGSEMIEAIDGGYRLAQ